MNIYVDADACPVKDEIYRVAGRHEVPVVVVANSWMRIPDQPGVRLEVVSNGFDAADDWIVEQCGVGDVVITADIPLADRCLKKEAYVLGPKGEPFTEDNIGTAMVSREMTADMRAMGDDFRRAGAVSEKGSGDFSAGVGQGGGAFETEVQLIHYPLHCMHHPYGIGLGIRIHT